LIELLLVRLDTHKKRSTIESNSMKKIAILIPYFGKFPEWADFFFETIKRNSSIDFIFYTDCDTQKYKASNITFVKISFEEYVSKVNQYLNFEFQPKNAYKLCDLRPLFGMIHKGDFKNYDFYGWTDMDLIFGDIRSFYTNDILKSYDVLSTHSVRISGHLALFKNTKRNRNMYNRIYNWENRLKHPDLIGIDEQGMMNAYSMTIFDRFNKKFKVEFDNLFIRIIKKIKTRKLYMKEQYTTPFTPIPWLDNSINSCQPSDWFYKDGNITNLRDGERSFMYLHFMNFKNSRWRHDNTKAPWEGVAQICFAEKKDMNKGIQINHHGIYPLVNS